MTVPPTTEILGLPMHMTTLEGAGDLAERWIRQGERRSICHVAVHSVIVSRDEPALFQAISGASLRATDGMPLVWIGRRRGFACGRVYGPDFMRLLCTRVSAWRDRDCRHFLYGSTPEVLDALAAHLRAEYPGIVIAGTLAPPMGMLSEAEEARHRTIIDASRANVVWVGLGAPKQELWMARNRPLLAAELLVGVGAAFDFLAGLKPQAPRWIRQAGLEWAFRLITEPRRLAHRYATTIPRFLALVALSELRRRG